MFLFTSTELPIQYISICPIASQRNFENENCIHDFNISGSTYPRI